MNADAESTTKCIAEVEKKYRAYGVRASRDLASGHILRRPSERQTLGSIGWL